MRMPLREEPWPPGPNGPIPCPVCEKPWWPWAGSRLPCHAKCLFTEEEEKAIVQDPRTINEVAEELGVTYSVIRSMHKRWRTPHG